MHHEISLISTVAVGLGLALVLGFLAARLKLPALVGYIGAGILIGPGTPGFVADTEIASQLAEIGVMLLMFGVGLHFSLDDLLAVKRIAVPGAVVQMAVATALGAGLATWWGWNLGAALVLIQAHIASAALLVIAIPDTLGVRQMIENARSLNPAIQVVVRSPNDEEAALLEIGGATRAFVAEQELAQAMLGHVLQVAKPHPAV